MRRTAGFQGRAFPTAEGLEGGASGEPRSLEEQKELVPKKPESGHQARQAKVSVGSFF